jgi:signal peptidase I
MSAEMPISEPETLPTATSLPVRPAQPNRFRSAIAQILQAVAIGALAVGSYFFISHFFVQSVKVVGVSMVPTLADSEHYLLNRWVYYFHPPKRSDVVVLRDPSDNGFSVKRVIAVAGDSIYMKNGYVYVNGQKLTEPYLAPDTATFTNTKYKDELFTCGKGQFFVLGDNRMNSIDSRAYGPVPIKNILGMIVR